jgi:hypothetical protein
MKRSLFILILGLVVAIAGFSAFYFVRAAQERAILREEHPELAWLKDEFNLSDADFQKVCTLHDAYLPQCAEMCRRIGKKNAEIQELISKTNTVTPEIETKIREASLIRAECHQNMLKHFFAVSQSMPKSQGDRYMAWVQQQTLLDTTGMLGQDHATESTNTAGDGHHE